MAARCGSTRSSRPGPLWFYTIESIFLFADETRIVTVPVSGQRLREILENSVSDRNFGSGGFLQVSGIKFTVDRGRPSGSPHRRPGHDADRQLDLSGPDLSGSASRPISHAAVATATSIPEAAGPCGSAASAPRVADLVVAHFRPASRRPDCCLRQGSGSSSGNRAPSKQLCPSLQPGSEAGSTIPSKGGAGVPSCQ